jgi:hypothetical protein
MKRFALTVWGMGVILILWAKKLKNDGYDVGLAIYERSQVRCKEDFRTLQQKSRYINHYGFRSWFWMPYTPQTGVRGKG